MCSSDLRSSAYGTVCTYAELLGEDYAVQLLQETLNEEKATDENLTALSKDINVQAAEENEEEGESISPKKSNHKRPPARKTA